MSAAIVLPSLTNWTKTRITSIFSTTNQADFKNAVNAFLSDKAKVTLNGTHVSRADFINRLQAEKFDEEGAVVTFNNVVEVPKDSRNPIAAGSVGLFYKATIAEAIAVRDTPVTNQVTASVNVVIEQDPDVPKPAASPIRGFFDGRRVIALDQVSTQGAAPAQDA